MTRSRKMARSAVTFYFVFLLLLFVRHHLLVNGQQYFGSPLQSSIAIQTSMPTVTVRGFLNFRTTVDGTVIVFTPSPSSGQTPSSVPPVRIVPTQPPPVATTTQQIRPTRINQGPVQNYPTGLVTVLGGTVVQGGSTTVYETKVIGTYISGKYAQILSSTTRVNPENEMTSPTIRPTMSYSSDSVKATKIYSNMRQVEKPKVKSREESVKEDEPTVNAISSPKKVLPLRSKTQKLMESAKARHLNARLQLNPLKSRWAKISNEETENSESNESKTIVKVRKARVGTRRFTLPPRQSPRVKMNRFKSKLPATQAEEMQQYFNSKEKEEIKKTESSSASPIDDKIKEQILENLSSTSTPENANEPIDQSSVDASESLTIDPSKVIKEVQTITSEVTQHVEGNHLQVKTLTTTTTIERTLHPSESEFDTQVVKPTIDISANDLEATYIPETPALVISRTYSVTERTMRTTIVPVFDGTATQSHTVTESFFIRKLITAYRTLPPGDVILIDSTSTSNVASGMNTAIINSTEITDLSMAEQAIHGSSVEGTIMATQMPGMPVEAAESSSLSPVQSVTPSIEPSLGFGMPQMFQQPNPFAQKFDLNNPLLLAAVLQNPQLAAVYFGLQQMKQPTTQYNTITKPTQVLQTETVYNTKVVSFYDGRQTRSRTILEPAGTTEKMLNTFTTEVVPVVNNNFAMQQAQMQNMFATQLGMMPQFQVTPTLQTSTVLKTVTTVTDATMTKSKVYTLVYNAFSTRFRTITSTSVVPTTVTTVLTETVTNTPTSSLMPNMNFFG